MIANIRDGRKQPHRWKRVTAIIEATWHDRKIEDSDQAEQPDGDDYVLYDERRGVSLSEAISWAHERPGQVTLFLYDDGPDEGEDDEATEN